MGTGALIAPFPYVVERVEKVYNRKLYIVIILVLHMEGSIAPVKMIP